MNIIGHLMIAYSVRKNVNQQTGVRLSMPGFLFGNILPDISARYKDHPHFFKNSFHYVLDRVAKLQTDFDPGQIQTLSYSQSVGVITHYLSDFFCYAHSEGCTYSIYQHYWYEFCMLWQYRDGLLFYKKSQPKPPLSIIALETSIRNQRKDYTLSFQDKKQDFYFALKVSSEVAVCMVNEALSHMENHLLDGSEIKLYV